MVVQIGLGRLLQFWLGLGAVGGDQIFEVEIDFGVFVFDKQIFVDIPVIAGFGVGNVYYCDRVVLAVDQEIQSMVGRRRWVIAPPIPKS